MEPSTIGYHVVLRMERGVKEKSGKIFQDGVAENTLVPNQIDGGAFPAGQMQGLTDALALRGRDPLQAIGARASHGKAFQRKYSSNPLRLAVSPMISTLARPS